MLAQVKQTFDLIPNIAGAMANSPELLKAFLGLFQQVHSGTFTEAEIQTLLLTNAVTNACNWAALRRDRRLAVEAISASGFLLALTSVARRPYAPERELPSPEGLDPAFSSTRHLRAGNHVPLLQTGVRAVHFARFTRTP